MKIAWVLGAGASKEAGYPLVSDFLSQDYFGNNSLIWKLADFSDETINRIRQEHEHFLSQDLDLNCLMATYLQDDDAAKIRRLNGYIYQVIESSLRFHSQFWDVHYMSAFANFLASSASSVLSFNYDTLVEEQLGLIYANAERDRPSCFDKCPAPYDHGLHDTEVVDFLHSEVTGGYWSAASGSGYVNSSARLKGIVPVLKLHGSLGYFYCRSCLALIYSPLLDDWKLISFSQQRSDRFDSTCPACGDRTISQAFLVPPASDRSFPVWQALDETWRRATEELHAADVIVVAGYSLPQEDVRARELLRDVAASDRAKKWVVVDPSLAHKSGANYGTVIGDFLPYPETFGRFIADLMCYWTESLLPHDGSFHHGMEDLFRSMMSADAGRAGESFPQSISLGQPVDRIVSSHRKSGPMLENAAIILGACSHPDAPRLLARAAQETRSALVAISCVSAIGGYPTQDAIDWCALHSFDQRVRVRQLSPDEEFAMPIVAVNYIAAVRIRGLLVAAPHLDFARAGWALLWSRSHNPDPRGNGLHDATLRLGEGLGLIDPCGELDNDMLRWPQSVLGSDRPDEAVGMAIVAANCRLALEASIANGDFDESRKNRHSAQLLYMTLKDRFPRTFRCHFAELMGMSAYLEIETGNSDAAVAWAGAATTHWEPIAKKEMLVHGTKYVRTLLTFAECLAQPGPNEESVERLYKAFRFVRLLQRRHRGLFGDVLLEVLASLVRLAAIDRETEALGFCCWDVCQEALTGKDPAVKFSQDALLAGLQTVAVRFSHAGRWSDALRIGQAVVSVRLQREAQDVENLYECARAVIGCGRALRALEQHAEADSVQALARAIAAHVDRWLQDRMRPLPHSLRRFVETHPSAISSLAGNDGGSLMTADEVTALIRAVWRSIQREGGLSVESDT